MSLPPRSLLALGIVAVIAALIVGSVFLLAWWRPMSTTARATLIGAIIVLTTIALWIVLIWPAYWD